MNRVSDHTDLFREVFDHAFDAILMLDPKENRVLDANRRAQKMLGYSREDLRRQPLSEIVVHPGGPFSTREYSEQGWIGPLVFRARDGHTVLTETSISLVESATGAYLIAAARESEGRRAAADEAGSRVDELRRVARISTVSELAAALANEIHQPLAAILLNARFVERTTDDETLSATLRETLADIAQDSRRAGDTVWSLRRWLRGDEPVRSPLDMSDVIREIAALLHEDTARENVALILDLAPDLPRVLGDRLHLQLVVRNLARNAIENMSGVAGERRTLTLETAAHGEAVRTVVRDRGSGLTPEARDHMFEPFFTTHPGQLGLGLAICRTIIESHGGRLWAESNPGGGSVVQFTLPAEKKPRTHGTRPVPHSESKEDEDFNRAESLDDSSPLFGFGNLRRRARRLEKVAVLGGAGHPVLRHGRLRQLTAVGAQHPPVHRGRPRNQASRHHRSERREPGHADQEP